MELAIGVPAHVGAVVEASPANIATLIILAGIIGTYMASLTVWALYTGFWVRKVRRISENAGRYKVNQAWPPFSSRICTFSEKGKGYYYEDGQYERIDEEKRLLIVDMLEQEDDAKREAVEARKRVELAKQNKEKADAEAAKELANQSELQSLAKEEIKGKQAKRGGVTVADPDRRGSVSIVNRS